MKYPKYYRKKGSAIWRKTETEGMQVITPDSAKEILPLSMTKVTYPSKERFDEAMKEWEQVDQDMFEQYVKNFYGRVDTDVKMPMEERQIQRELIKIHNLVPKAPEPPAKRVLTETGVPTPPPSLSLFNT